MKIHSMNRVGDARTLRVLRVAGLVAALGAVGCSGSVDDGVARDGELDSVEQALDFPMCPPSCPIPTYRPRAFGPSCLCLPSMPTSIFTNLARRSGVQAFQSSTLDDGDRLRAIDGNRDGVYDHHSVTHTNVGPVPQSAPYSSPNQQWWTVDLGAIRKIDHVTIWNRTDCCADRLGAFIIYAINPGFGNWYPIGGANMNSNRVIDIDATNGGTREVRTQTIWIQKNDDNYLSLAEVEVWGQLN